VQQGCRGGAADVGSCLVVEGFRAAGGDELRMDRQTLRDWVHRYNAAGLAGCRTAATGSSAKLTAEQSAAVAQWSVPVRASSKTGWFAGAH